MAFTNSVKDESVKIMIGNARKMRDTILTCGSKQEKKDIQDAFDDFVDGSIAANGNFATIYILYLNISAVYNTIMNNVIERTRCVLVSQQKRTRFLSWLFPALCTSPVA